MPMIWVERRQEDTCDPADESAKLPIVRASHEAGQRTNPTVNSSEGLLGSAKRCVHRHIWSIAAGLDQGAVSAEPGLSVVPGVVENEHDPIGNRQSFKFSRGVHSTP